MHENSLKYLEDRYDALLKQITDNLNRALNDLKKDKTTAKERRNELVHKFHNEQMELVENRKAELVATETATSLHADNIVFQDIEILHVELKELIEKEIGITTGKMQKINEDPERLDKDIELVEGLLKYVRENTGSRTSKRKRLELNTDAMYAEIEKVYQDVISRRKEIEITRTHFEPLQREINAKTRDLLKKINDEIDRLLGI